MRPTVRRRVSLRGLRRGFQKRAQWMSHGENANRAGVSSAQSGRLAPPAPGSLGV
jgi:hypothetical protein